MEEEIVAFRGETGRAEDGGRGEGGRSAGECRA